MKDAPRRASTFAASRGPLTASSVERRLWCVEGFVWLHGPGLLGRRAQRSFDVWSGAEARAVVPLLALRRVEATLTARRCITYAFWTQDPPESLAVDGILARSRSMDASVVRRESLPYAELSPWRGTARPYDCFTLVDDEVALTLSDPARGRYVFTHLDRTAAPDRALAVWARLGGIDYIHPIRRDLTC